MFLVLVQIIVMILTVVMAVAYMTWMERKIIGAIQNRYGVKHTGPFGLLQPFADVLKLITKESFTPDQVSKPLFRAAPLIVFVPAILSFSVIPFSYGLWVSDISVSLLFVLAMGSLATYGIVFAGWSSNSKYPMISSLRSTAQMISYEVPLFLSLIGVIILTGSLSLKEIVEYQNEHMWLVFPQFLGFVLFAVSAVAETNRAPFDLAEAETELVGGFFTEYPSMGFALFFLAEYASMFLMSAVAVTVFLGGWSGPFINHFDGSAKVVIGLMYFVIKVYVLMFIFVWLRATFPRLRYDQLMSFAWLYLIPLGLFNIILTAVLAYIF